MKTLALAIALTAATATAHAADKERKQADLSGRTAAAQMQATPQTAGLSDRSAAAAATPQVRSWAEIDTNRDHLVSAEEMEKWLEAQRRK